MNAPTANTIAAAEHAIALMCALARNVAQADNSMKARAPPSLAPARRTFLRFLNSDPLPPSNLLQKGEWKRNKYVGTSLVDKTLAIIGFGKAR